VIVPLHGATIGETASAFHMMGIGPVYNPFQNHPSELIWSWIKQ